MTDYLQLLNNAFQQWKQPTVENLTHLYNVTDVYNERLTFIDSLYAVVR